MRSQHSARGPAVQPWREFSPALVGVEVWGWLRLFLRKLTEAWPPEERTWGA